MPVHPAVMGAGGDLGVVTFSGPGLVVDGGDIFTEVVPHDLHHGLQFGHLLSLGVAAVYIDQTPTGRACLIVRGHGLLRIVRGGTVLSIGASCHDECPNHRDSQRWCNSPALKPSEWHQVSGFGHHGPFGAGQ